MKSKDIEYLSKRILILVAMIGLSSCLSNPVPEPVSGSQIVPDSSEITASASQAESSEGEIPAEDQEPDPKDECLICHSDQQTLVDTAKPVDIKESESSGEG